MIGLVPRDHWEHNLRDLFCGLTAALGPGEQSKVLHITEIGDCISTRSGRSGLVAALRALNLPPGARIGVPLYCCPVVFRAIMLADCIPCFIDIEPDTFCISPKDLSEKLSQFEAIIAVHMFGNLCDISKLKDASNGKPIIEDCAQSLGSKIDGRMAGSFGDIAFFSFRSGKYLSVGEGGALFSSDLDIRSQIIQLVTTMPAPERTEEFIHVVKVYIKSMLRRRPLYGLVGYPLWSIYNKKADYNVKASFGLSQIYRSDLTITKRRLALFDSVIKRQRANADFYKRSLKLDSGMLCLEKPGTYYNRYHYPITFPSTEHRDLVAAYLFRHKIDTMKYLDDVVSVATKNYGYVGDCPVAEQLSKRVLIIPSYYSLKKSEVQRIAQCLNSGWEEIKSCD